MNRTAETEVRSGVGIGENRRESSLYLHIPFCERKCIYCDFYSVEGLSGREAFVHALLTEIELAREYGTGDVFTTVFFGGGTPTLLTPAQVAGILDCLHGSYVISDDAEITMEANPGTITAETLAGYLSAGVNRLSIGIQSFHEEELSFLGRIHNSGQAVEAVHLAREAGFRNLSIDLIYSLPGQSIQQWGETLSRAVSLNPDHISAYSLIVEEHTPLAGLVRSGQVRANLPETDALMFEYTSSTLRENGFDHYEVSNYAKPGFRSAHNLNYWRHGTYLGLGPSAHSFRVSERGGPVRSWNVASVSAYVARLAEATRPTAGEEVLDRKALFMECLFLGLRSEGVNLARLRNEFGVDFLNGNDAELQTLLTERLARLDNDVLSLTPAGYLLCDEICARLTVSAS